MGDTAAVVSGVTPTGVANLFPVTNIDGSGVVNEISTTQFVSDKNIVSATKISPVDVDACVYESSADILSQEIKSFLAKPIILVAGNLTTTDTFSSFSSFDNPSDLLTNPVYADKVRGFLGFRATTVFRLVVNANRFQQGRYILGYVPLGGSPESVGGAWVNDHLNSLVQRTTVPHVELDLCCDSQAVIKIPYSSIANFYPFKSTFGLFGGLGTIQLYPYSPLVAASGNTSCSYAIYAHFEDVVLISAAVPQSGRGFSSTVLSKNATEVEQDSANIGPLSSTLIRVRDAANIFAKVPLLSSYANSVSWFADIGASAAKVFGWRKPVVLAPSTRVTQNYLPYAANNDGPDTSFPISLSYENQVGMARGFSATDVDEMDFSFLTSIPVWLSTTPWLASDVSGTRIYSTAVDPLHVVTTTVNAQAVNQYSPMGFIAAHFSNWRGSIVFKIKFVKTEFHSGRLVVWFSPRTALGASVLPTLTETSYLNRQIIDIRETNEFTFVIPFISEASYLSLGSSIGNLGITVLDPLVAPATVSSSITMLVEKCGGPDLEFAVPTPFTSSVYTGIIPQSGSAFSSVEQSTNVCSNQDSTLGATTIKPDFSINALNCVGEKISSVRTLLKLPCFATNTGTYTPANYLLVTPFIITTGTVFSTTNTLPSQVGDLYSNFASCYTFSRGGVRIKFLDNVAVTATQPGLIALYTNQPVFTGMLSNLAVYNTAAPNGQTYTTTRNNMPVVYYKPGYSGEVQVPQYGRYHSRANASCIGNNLRNYDDSFGAAPRVYLVRQTYPLSTVDTHVLRSGSDDLNFGSFISIPPMITTLAFNA